MGEFEYHSQPADQDICGQCCVAMLAGVSVEMACAVTLHYGSTTDVELRRALAHFGLHVEEEMQPFTGTFPGPSIALLHNRHAPLKPDGQPYGHWTLYDGTRFLDPAYGIRSNYPDGFYISHFMHVRK